ncbi:MAG TPA: T6SS amidase immunity protein Tai4 family protein [Pseudomonadales bacterium]|nr:T6SS amidase immunity protein Tai4 family protein [Pseudomonadales bacterium]
MCYFHVALGKLVVIRNEFIQVNKILPIRYRKEIIHAPSITVAVQKAIKMTARLKLFFLLIVSFPCLSYSETSGSTAEYSTALTQTYSQKTLLKNWALSVCLAAIAKDKAMQEDANATAGAYLEFGKQPIEAYEQLHTLAEKYSKKKYQGSVDSEFNTMKCIDLFHSKELDQLTEKLVKRR